MIVDSITGAYDMHVDLPLDLLRTFVAMADLGTVTGAAERIGRTQPAVTLQLRRLETLLGRPLFERRRRRLTLAPSGEALLHHARRLLEANDSVVAALAAEPLTGPVRVGLIQDFADTLLAGALAHFARTHPEARLDVQVGGSALLRRSLADGRLDVALCISQPREEPIVAAPMCWLGAAELLQRDPLPLVLLDAPCAYRDAALMALEAAGRRWRVAVSTPSLSGLKAAVAAGLGLTVRTGQMAHLGELPEESMPPLGKVGYVLISTAEASPAARHLAGLLTNAVMAVGGVGL
ncbi:MAG: LysR family transcriptional regulator [Rhodospirillaceae bacterium]|nr:LysR family transcriptional regulator [Rhodospirillales bacterium]